TRIETIPSTMVITTYVCKDPGATLCDPHISAVRVIAPSLVKNAGRPGDLVNELRLGKWACVTLIILIIAGAAFNCGLCPCVPHKLRHKHCSRKCDTRRHDGSDHYPSPIITIGFRNICDGERQVLLSPVPPGSAVSPHERWDHCAERRNHICQDGKSGRRPTVLYADLSARNIQALAHPRLSPQCLHSEERQQRLGYFHSFEYQGVTHDHRSLPRCHQEHQLFVRAGPQPS